MPVLTSVSCRSSSFHDPYHPALFVANDSPVSGGLGQAHGQEAQRLVARQQRFQRARADQWRIAIQDQHAGARWNTRHRLLHGVPGAEPFRLWHPADVEIGAGRSHRFGFGIVDHVDTGRRQAHGGFHNVPEHRPPAHGMQHLGQA
jgi:hypothetical protein